MTMGTMTFGEAVDWMLADPNRIVTAVRAEGETPTYVRLTYGRVEYREGDGAWVPDMNMHWNKHHMWNAYVVEPKSVIEQAIERGRKNMLNAFNASESTIHPAQGRIIERLLNEVVNLTLDEAKKAVASPEQWSRVLVSEVHKRIDALKVKL